MEKNKGITLITLIMTVIILLIIAGLSINYGINTYKSSKVMKFETYMKILQKKVDIMIEEGIDYTTVGTALTNGQKDRLQAIMPTIDTSEPQLRYFSSDNIEEAFDEVYKNQVLIHELTGETPKYFRSGTAYYDDVSVEMIDELGLKAVNYNVLGDAGGTFNPFITWDRN